MEEIGCYKMTPPPKKSRHNWVGTVAYWELYKLLYSIHTNKKGKLTMNIDWNNKGTSLTVAKIIQTESCTHNYWNTGNKKNIAKVRDIWKYSNNFNPSRNFEKRAEDLKWLHVVSNENEKHFLWWHRIISPSNNHQKTPGMMM